MDGMISFRRSELPSGTEPKVTEEYTSFLFTALCIEDKIINRIGKKGVLQRVLHKVKGRVEGVPYYVSVLLQKDVPIKVGDTVSGRGTLKVGVFPSGGGFAWYERLEYLEVNGVRVYEESSWPAEEEFF
ncbi:hypothetical protein UFOVP380_55 [uncultured Caudovirales phage]|uniref:Uncharacterized protein n=1 Tax=uncultured Caudovirales phage TaxID=2100421 RepID=A0A6J7X033_9CAUD|nr:hypothetical protein UFOVP380_55 [uncultured Caudovirales phage]